MPIQLRSTYIFIFNLIVIFATYGWWVFGILGVDYFTGPEALTRISRAISILIIGGFAFEIIVMFSYSIISAFVFKKKRDDFIVDQRDKQILYKSMYNSHFVLCGGLFIAIGALALGWSPFWVFNLMVLGYALSVVMELGSKIFFYKRGF